MADLIELLQLAEKHDWPVAGGVLDQADNFRQALRCWNQSLADIRKNDS